MGRNTNNVPVEITSEEALKCRDRGTLVAQGAERANAQQKAIMSKAVFKTVPPVPPVGTFSEDALWPL